MYHTIFFDLDGTLLDSSEGVYKCFRYALERMGAPPLPAQQEPLLIGPPLEDSFASFCGFSPADSLKALGFYRERYRTDGYREVSVVPGMEEALAALKAAGLRLAVASSKEEGGCHMVLDAAGLSRYFDLIAGHNVELANTKAAVVRSAMDRLGLGDGDVPGILMVGDRKYDVVGAARWGIRCLGFDFCGFAPKGELEEAGAVAVVHTAAEIVRFILERQ